MGITQSSQLIFSDFVYSQNPNYINFAKTSSTFVSADSYWLSTGLNSGDAGHIVFSAKDYIYFYDYLLSSGTITSLSDYADAINYFTSVGYTQGHLCSVIFDAQFYFQVNPSELQWYNNFASTNNGVQPTYLDVYNKYLTYGIQNNLSSSPVFNPEYYINNNLTTLQEFFGSTFQQNPGLCAAIHYLYYGVNDGIQGSALFNAAYFLANNPDLLTTPTTDHTYNLNGIVNAFGVNLNRAAAMYYIRVGYKLNRPAVPPTN